MIRYWKWLDIESNQILRMRNFWLNWLIRILAKTRFYKEMHRCTRRRFRKLTEVWLSKESLSSESLQTISNNLCHLVLIVLCSTLLHCMIALHDQTMEYGRRYGMSLSRLLEYKKHWSFHSFCVCKRERNHLPHCGKQLSRWQWAALQKSLHSEGIKPSNKSQLVAWAWK